MFSLTKLLEWINLILAIYLMLRTNVVIRLLSDITSYLLSDPLMCDDLLCDVTQALIGYAISHSSLIGPRISCDVNRTTSHSFNR